ncbi:hypothetical protein FHS29_001242 [Saccharothrix tamanrassetensis]|uniref:Transcription factor zinc-finger domain-containing protein n=1 Tax=Saccharothrix tamanrassetensis TaxID=1051531 RepID=A0A841C824_9PSEU|nr:zf-TFIIB domain-containing protein [Saccharothrix tamanrassetensis]MBB5954672.1 hypothetical protein [Saccharothrix tamanrassetensis]
MRTLGYVICPKCQDLMRTITRGAVHIEQCDNCKGVFLDGGELEQIVAAEREHYATPPPPYPDQAPQSPAGSPPPYQPPPGTAPPPLQPGHAPAPLPPGHAPPAYPPGYPPGYYDQGYYGQRRKRSFLEELLD